MAATSRIFEKYEARASGAGSGGGDVSKRPYNSMFQKLERQEKAELKGVKDLDCVSADSKKNLNNLLGNRHKYAGFRKRDAKEAANELKNVKNMDKVNPQSQKNLSNLLGNTFKRQQMHARDYKEDRKELDKVKNMDKVNAQSIKQAESLLANTIGKGKSAIQAGRLTHADCRAVFDKYKTTPESGPEYLTEQSYKTACRDLMVAVDVYGFGRLDKDKSGTIEFREFLKVLLANNK